MTIEQRQKLSVLTVEAVENQDVNTLIEIKEIIEAGIENETVQFDNEFEWFESKLTPELMEQVFS